MYLFTFFFLSWVLGFTSALKPSCLPSGKPKVFTVDKFSRINDLTLIDPGRSKFIAKHWENNILHTALEIRKEDEHLLQQIDELYRIVNSNDGNDKSHIYISWSPRCVVHEILFIVIAEINVGNKTFIIKHVIQSPFWESKQIESRHLKYALEDLLNDDDALALDMSEIYKKNKRVELDWVTMVDI